MTLHEHDVQHEDLAKVNAQSQPYQAPRSPLALLTNFFGKTLTIAEWEARKIRHDFTDLITRAVQPALWILVFGEVFTRIRAIPTGSKNVSYLEFMAPGILAQSVLFISIFAGIAIIWERDLGVIHKFLASPTPRGSLVLGKALSSGIRALPQAIVIYLLALILGVKMNFNPLALLGVLVFVVMGAGCFSTFSLIIACLLKTRDRVMGIGQVLTMPMFFASNAIYPIAIMPGWLQAIAHINPLTYVVDGLRSLMLANTAVDMASVGRDFGILLVVTVVLVTIGAALYPRIVQ
ncbi:ABC transporter permease [Dictyobacter aurantiacus]|uniref:Transport permease protein n=1 Tax=Dictyobacter aurantiacus TaxID=1936993 RepID=A0A401ZNW4_9CHLR|nr:ABC transporter permease [Dictyobacter aurantiacus]GCE08500.1 transport permease protein [Dictyobacter aurantiacus]